MLKRIRIPILILASMAAAASYADCDPPAEVSVPDGAKASEEEMTKGQEYIRVFMAANERYRKCLDDEVSSLGESATDEQKASNTYLYNLSVDREQELVETFNNQVRSFNEANP